MVKTLSTMLDLGEQLPSFQLPDVVSQTLVSPDSMGDKSAILVMFICRHCPYVIHVQEELAKLGIDYKESPLGIIAISSNDPKTHPHDAPANLAAQAEEQGFTFPYCFDESQEVAKAFKAACTPDFFLFDNDRRLVYRGQLDDSRPGTDIPVTGADLRGAIDNLLGGRTIPAQQKASMGCNIKWTAGNEPDYFSS